MHHLLEVLEWPTCVASEEGLARLAGDRIEIVSDRSVAAHTAHLIVHAATRTPTANVFSLVRRRCVHKHTGTAFVVVVVAQ
jgi:hypothetical protein